MVKSTGDEFDRRMKIREGHVPAEIAEAAIHVNDTMELAVASAMQVFGSKVKFTGADVIAIYDRMQSEWRRREKATDQSE